MENIIDVKECYDGLKDNKMSVKEFNGILNAVTDIKEFALGFIGLVKKDIEDDHKNLESIINALALLCQKNDLTEEMRSKIVEALIEIAKKIQDKQFKPSAIIAILGMLLASIIAIIYSFTTNKNK